ncbi:hypothetical protein BCV70DRAFT_217448 [Testicularia cyperi]|uniref:Uncharacterized protein n=1 Tax=Testicularia cyperi TaxID=1882483 RepID=A0A317XPG5_9BASI|nr:hypothetical protein BCV70DRAFT_217448 [Testicularia cyperi]
MQARLVAMLYALLAALLFMMAAAPVEASASLQNVYRRDNGNGDGSPPAIQDNRMVLQPVRNFPITLPEGVTDLNQFSMTAYMSGPNGAEIRKILSTSPEGSYVTVSFTQSPFNHYKISMYPNGGGIHWDRFTTQPLTNPPRLNDAQRAVKEADDEFRRQQALREGAPALPGSLSDAPPSASSHAADFRSGPESKMIALRFKINNLVSRLRNPSLGLYETANGEPILFGNLDRNGVPIISTDIQKAVNDVGVARVFMDPSHPELQLRVIKDSEGRFRAYKVDPRYLVRMPSRYVGKTLQDAQTLQDDFYREREWDMEEAERKRANLAEQARVAKEAAIQRAKEKGVPVWYEQSRTMAASSARSFRGWLGNTGTSLSNWFKKAGGSIKSSVSSWFPKAGQISPAAADIHV